VLELAKLVLQFTGSTSAIEHLPLPVDDPTRRRPDITVAEELLGWAPKVTPEEGLLATIEWFSRRAG
jgi:nucleoside-diphosphate-sugar epimerase